MELVRSATYWETLKILRDDEGRYHQLRENSFGQYRLTPLADRDREELTGMFDESNDMVFEQYLFKASDRPQTIGPR
jgi:hypothetical protein